MLLIYLPEITERCKYVFEWIFREELGIEYQLTAHTGIFEAHNHQKINYSFKCNNDEFFIKASPLLFQNTINEIDILVEKKFGTTVLFANDTCCNIGFDIFAAVFYMISRYEEYLPFSPDSYGRYKASDSLAGRNKFLQQPVVDAWIDIFRCCLVKRFSSLKFRPAKFNCINTYDIDIAYAFAGRSVYRLLGSALTDACQLKLKNIILRAKCVANVKNDPWNVYNYLQETIIKNKIQSVFFFLLADYAKYDKNIDYRHPLMEQLVAKISAFADIGIHPSFKTPKNPEKILLEKERLEWLSGKVINKSRQHYLRFSLPVTYNHLISAGIKEDYSMCFADMPGFRAGTSKPFYFYDLKSERPTGLKIFPVTFMEGSFIDYLQMTPGAALEYISTLLQEVKKVNGTFISIWHNHTVSDTGIYKGWRWVHDRMIGRMLSLT